MKALLYTYVVVRIDEIVDKIDHVIKKVAPYFLCFVGGFFAGVIVNTFAHMR